MTALTSPTGPLPARVYWVRRMMVFGTLFLVVFGTARIFATSDDSDASDVAQVARTSDPATQAAGEKAAGEKAAGGGEAPAPSGAPAPSDGTQPAASTVAGTTPASTEPTPTPTETPKPLPSGECKPAEVKVVPESPALRTTLKVTFGLTLTSTTVPACTFTVSPDTVTMKIDSGQRNRPDVVWQSQYCTDAIPTQEITVYKDHETTVPVVWSGRRSDKTCSTDTSWAKSGWYHAQAATYGGEPSDIQFELTRLQPVTVTHTVTPKPQPSPSSPTASEAGEGAVEPADR
ncbi:hypothetical protein [Nocardioides yefusunii]|uniref:Secreted protein n=1 Tax=Nocardioides yefusunii TaxID=2500546 RepID=A0ABW1QXJ2_9ACTN|nr:hypothetical protein [Nocardioides yefusunii]